MTTKYKGEGAMVDHVASGAKVSGAVIVLGTANGACVGIAHGAIADTETGSVHIEGVFSFVKVTGAVIKQGETVMWDASASNIDDNAATPASGDVMGFGIAMADYGSGVLLADIKLLPGNGAITA